MEFYSEFRDNINGKDFVIFKGILTKNGESNRNLYR